MSGLLRCALRNVPFLRNRRFCFRLRIALFLRSGRYPIEFACFDGRAQRTKLRRGLSSTSGWFRWFFLVFVDGGNGRGQGRNGE